MARDRKTKPSSAPEQMERTAAPEETVAAQTAAPDEVPADLPLEDVILRGPEPESSLEYEVDDDFPGGTFQTLCSIMRRGEHIEMGSVVQLTAVEASPIRSSLERVRLNDKGEVVREVKRRIPRAMSVVRG